MRTTHLVILLSLIATPSFGQTVPPDSSLSRIGLERAWIGQARVDPHRDRLTHLTVDERYVYAQSSNGSMTAFDAENGERAWVVQLGPPNRTTFGAVSNADLVLVVTGMTVYGVEKSSGHILWTAKMPASASTSAYLDDEFFYIGTSDGSVYAFNMKVVAYTSRTGRLPGSFDPSTKEITSPIGPVAARNLYMWRYRTGRALKLPPVLASESILFGDSFGQIYGVTSGTPEELGGKLIFEFQAGDGQTNGMLSKGSIAYVSTGDGRIVAVDSGKGKVLWRYGLGHKIVGEPLMVDDKIYLTAETEGIIALDSKLGQQVMTPNGPWRIRGGIDFVGITKDRVFAVDRVGNLVAVDRETAGPRGSIPLVPYKIRIMNDLNDRLYLASHRGQILCMRPINAEKPTFYRNADRTPIDPLLAEEKAAAAAAEGSETEAASEDAGRDN
ncbi:MAG: PQQ-binding-like beta-propeller repeat protein [Planctomycetaceae bacterium]